MICKNERTRTDRPGRRAGLGIVLALALLAAGGPPVAARADEAAAVRIEREMEQAKNLGAKGQLPHAWWSLDARLEAAKKNGASAETWAAIEQDARRLVNAAAFVKEMRQQKSGLEAMLGRFDQSLAEIGALQGVEVDPVLSGSKAAADLLRKLTVAALSRQVLIDSLTVENRRLQEIVGGQFEAQEATITALRVEVSSLRQKLWETELRVGVAEADRSAAESVLTRKQQREQAVAATRSLFGDDEADIILTAEGEVVMRLFGLSFGVGSAVLGSGQDALVAKIIDAVQLFPGSTVSLEGHTDDTGGRDANLRLSRRRAETVARVLESRLDWNPETIATAGFGPDRPIALNSTAEGRARNRRIDVIIRQAD